MLKEDNMKIKTAKSEILDPLQIANYFISTGSTLPLLSNILFEAEGDTLTLSATDMDLSAKIRCKVGKVSEPGKTTVNKKIVSLVKEFPDAEIIIETDKNENLSLKCAKSSYKIPTMPGEDFPVLPLEGKKLETIKISQKSLKNIIKNTAYAALKDSAKRNLNGVFLRFEGKTVEAVATDAHRLAYYTEELKEAVKSKFEYIVPLKTINELSKIIEKGDDKEITVNFYDKLIEFNLENIDIISRIIDESYPNYKQVIPKQANMVATVSKEELASALRRATALTSEKSKIIALKFEKGKLFINAHTQDEGEAFEEIDIKYDKDPIEVSYNAQYVMDVLKALDDESIEIKLDSSMTPGMIKPASGENILYIIMPIRK
jgi:DNA polymerase III subunit beta